jgi:hypothetical protein
MSTITTSSHNVDPESITTTVRVFPPSNIRGFVIVEVAFKVEGVRFTHQLFIEESGNLDADEAKACALFPNATVVYE